MLTRRPPPSLNGELDNVAAGGEDAGTAAEEAEGEEGGSLPAVARSAKPAAGRGRKVSRLDDVVFSCVVDDVDVTRSFKPAAGQGQK
eukprot:scaffold118353_cov24-Tisochrysis_lutea.AAC.1